jgi:hypothetical protein
VSLGEPEPKDSSAVYVVIEREDYDTPIHLHAIYQSANTSGLTAFLRWSTREHDIDVVSNDEDYG